MGLAFGYCLNGLLFIGSNDGAKFMTNFIIKQSPLMLWSPLFFCTWKLFSHLSVATVQTSTTAQVIRGLAGLPMLKNDPWRAMSLLKGRRRKTFTLAMIFSFISTGWVNV